MNIRFDTNRHHYAFGLFDHLVIDGQAWRIVKVGHSVGDGGFTTRVEMERAV